MRGRAEFGYGDEQAAATPLKMESRHAS
jgi:hypothetical protein